MSARSNKNTGETKIVKRHWKNKSGGGRKVGERAYDATILLRLYESDRLKIEQAAELSGDSMSGFAREAAIRAATRKIERDRPTKED